MYGLGIDIGSSATKAVILDDEYNLISSSIYPFGAGSSGTDQVLSKVFEQANLGWDDMAYSVATGYGRQRFDPADEQISEISCHAKGVGLLMPGVRTIVDIGGQDAKTLRLRPDGTLEGFMMNEKCAAGTGRFLETMARALESDVSCLEELGEQSTSPVEISSTCTVFAESEVISRLASGEAIPDIVAGIHRSAAKRTAGLVRRLGPVLEPVAMSGGVARNRGVVRALENELQVSIEVPELCQLCGVLGAAIYAIDRA